MRFESAANTNQVFGYPMTQEYSIDEIRIEWKNCDFEIQTIGKIYQNLINWFERIRKSGMNFENFERSLLCTFGYTAALFFLFFKLSQEG